MKTSRLIGMLPLVLVAAAGFAQDDNRAVPRGSGGGSSSGAESRHTGGSSSSSSSASSDSGSRGGGSSASSDPGNAYSPSSDAASRRPRPGTGSGTRGYGRDGGGDGGRYYSYPYSPYYYDPYYYSSWRNPGGLYGRYGYGYGYYDYGYAYGDYYGYYPSYYSRTYRYRSGNVAQLRTMVEPAKARVYVDGYYAGIADDFDGLLQRLNVSPGRHDITFKLEGYRSHTFSVYANRSQTLKLRWDMVRGSGETSESIGDESDLRSDRDADRDDDRDRDMERDERDESDPRGEVDADRNDRRLPAPPRDGARGELVLEVEPRDASVYVDGEFYGKASQLPRVELAVGRHRIEIVRPGYRTEEAEVTVGPEAKKVVVKLDRR